MSELFESIPKAIKERLVAAGYDCVEALPRDPESTRWDLVIEETGLSNADIKKVINVTFPKQLSQQGK
jgi:hypothetical protein